MTAASQKQISQLLEQSRNGNKEALDELMPIVYEELRRLARHYMRNERAGHTLQTTALVNEAYVRLVSYKMDWQSRAHFFAIAAQAMRRILIERARKHRSAKRGGDAQRISLDDAATVSPERLEEMLAVENALTTLEELDPRRGRIVELRFYGGLNVEETAHVLGISSPTVKREWRAAKAWLHRSITEGIAVDSRTLQTGR